jgi:hypothetical protein
LISLCVGVTAESNPARLVSTAQRLADKIVLCGQKRHFCDVKS